MVLVSTDTGNIVTKHSTQHLSNTLKHCRSSPTALLILGMYLIDVPETFPAEGLQSLLSQYYKIWINFIVYSDMGSLAVMHPMPFFLGSMSTFPKLSYFILFSILDGTT